MLGPRKSPASWVTSGAEAGSPNISSHRLGTTGPSFRSSVRIRTEVQLIDRQGGGRPSQRPRAYRSPRISLSPPVGTDVHRTSATFAILLVKSRGGRAETSSALSACPAGCRVGAGGGLLGEQSMFWACTTSTPPTGSPRSAALSGGAAGSPRWHSSCRASTAAGG